MSDTGPLTTDFYTWTFRFYLHSGYSYIYIILLQENLLKVRLFAKTQLRKTVVNRRLSHLTVHLE